MGIFTSAAFSMLLLFSFASSSMGAECTVVSLMAKQAIDPKLIPAPSSKPLSTLFEEVRALFLSEIASLTLEDKDRELLRKRLLTTQYKTKNCEGTSSPRAQYSRNSHTIEICEKTLSLPEVAQMVIFAHELGHSMDLCSMSSGFYEVKSDGRNIQFNPPLEHDTAIFVNEILKPETKFFVDSAIMAVSRGREILNALKKIGKIKKVEDGIALNKNPIRQVYRCLSSTSGYPALPNAERQICNGIDFTEAGAQIWATKIAARYINANLFNLSGADLYGMFSSIDIVRKGSNPVPRGKEKDFNEMFLKEKSIGSAFACYEKPAISCF